MILGHRAPSSLNMSSYRAIWTHFRSNNLDFFKKNQDLGARILVPRSWYQIFGGTGPRVTGEPPSRPPQTDIRSLS